MPTCTVLIPSHARPEALRACLAGLARQSVAPTEVLVGLDGGSPSEADAISREHRDALPSLRVLAMPRTGYIPVRRALLEAAQGEVFLSLNDDVLPGSGLLEAHLREHGSRTTLVTGPAPWKRPEQPSRFDDIVARAGLIFFDPAAAISEEGTVPYRYCVGLNFSGPTALVQAAGGFHDLPHTYGYDDIELAHRVCAHAGCAVRFAPGAIVEHDHRYTPLDVERREYQLGRAAHAYATVNPAFCRELFGRDIRSESELEFSSAYLRHMRPDAARIERAFCAHADVPSERIEVDRLELFAQHWILLKRYLWRWGLLDASTGAPSRFAPLNEARDLP